MPGVCEWTRKGWMEGWKNLRCDSIPSMQHAIAKLRQRLASDSAYFIKVYNYTFDFAKTEGQRSLAVEMACAFWALLLPHGLSGGALSYQPSSDFIGGDQPMDDGEEEGWRPKYNEAWFKFLAEKGGKGVSKDTWTMLPEFIRTIDSKFARHDETAAWPSTIDDFVTYAKEHDLVY